MKKLLLASLFFALSTQLNAAGVNLVKNGSFENPNIKTGTWTVLPSIAGWTTGGAGIEIRDNVAGTAYKGDQFAELDSHGRDSNSSISQTLSTMLGQVYELSFAYSPRIGQPESTNGISVFWNGALLDTISAAGSKIHNWVVYTFMVKGSGQDVLKFSATGTEDTLGGSLDDINVSAVPIPAAAFLLTPVVLGFMSLRRKVKVTASKR